MYIHHNVHRRGYVHTSQRTQEGTYTGGVRVCTYITTYTGGAGGMYVHHNIHTYTGGGMYVHHNVHTYTGGGYVRTSSEFQTMPAVSRLIACT